MSLLGKNKETNVLDPVTFEDDLYTTTAHYASEGIVHGLTVVPSVLAPTTDITVNLGGACIESGGNSKTVLYYEGDDLAVPDNTSGVHNLVVLKIDTTAATSTVELIAGSSGTDPDLTEGSGVERIPLARIVGTGGAITSSDITQDGITLTNNSTPEIIGKVARIRSELLSKDWVILDETLTYNAYNATTNIAAITVASGALNRFARGWRIKFTQPTDGVIYGIINDITDTTLYVQIQDDQDVDNEAITAPFINKGGRPQDMDLSRSQYTLMRNIGGTVSQSSPASGLYYNLGSDSITVGRGEYILRINQAIKVTRSAADTSIFEWGLATSVSGTPSLFSSIITFDQNAVEYIQDSRSDDVIVTAETTYYPTYGYTSGGVSELAIAGGSTTSTVAFVNAYL